MRRSKRCRVLVSNDDGIFAPGLRSLVAALAASDVADIYVCSPSGERSAQSMSITMGKSFAVFPIDVPGAKEAYAVDGSPADTVMLALNAPIWSFDDEVDGGSGGGEGNGDGDDGGGSSGGTAEKGPRLLRRLSSAGGSGSGSRRTLKHARSFSEAVEEAMVELTLHSPTGDDDDDNDASASAIKAAAASSLASSSFYYPHSRFDLVVSGTNKGDNLGHHCWYSGTVGAAREGALSALPSVAFSLDDHFTQEIGDYSHCSEFASAVVSAVLGLGTKHRRALMGHVLNVNFPSQRKCARRAAERQGAQGGGGGGGGGGGEKVKNGGNVKNGDGDCENGASSSSSSSPPERMRAIALTTQGGHCWRPGFDERYLRVEKDEAEAEAKAKAEKEEEKEGQNEAAVVSPRAVATAGARASQPETRYFKNVGGGMWEDREAVGTDSWAVDRGMASVVVLGLKQHALTRGGEEGGAAGAHAAELEEGERAIEAGKEVVRRAAGLLGVEAVLLPRA